MNRLMQVNSITTPQKARKMNKTKSSLTV